MEDLSEYLVKALATLLLQLGGPGMIVGKVRKFGKKQASNGKQLTQLEVVSWLLEPDQDP